MSAPVAVGVVMGSDSRLARHGGRSSRARRVRRRATRPTSCRPTACRRRCSRTASRPPRAGCGSLIAGAGGAAHLPGMLAVGHAAAGHRRAGAAEAPGRHGLAAVDRADARRACRWRRCRSAGPATPGCSRSRILAAGVDEEAAALRDRMVAFQAGPARRGPCQGRAAALAHRRRDRGAGAPGLSSRALPRAVGPAGSGHQGDHVAGDLERAGGRGRRGVEDVDDVVLLLEEEVVDQ